MLFNGLGKNILIFDGGMGSEIKKKGLFEFIPEELNIIHEKDIKDIHLSYSNANFIKTNTFGLNKIKYHGKYDIKELALKAISSARITNKYAIFDIESTGAKVKPIGNLDFDSVYEAFKEIDLKTKDLVDGYILETFSDLYEIKAAILAIKENSDKPIFTK